MYRCSYVHTCTVICNCRKTKRKILYACLLLFTELECMFRIRLSGSDELFVFCHVYELSLSGSGELFVFSCHVYELSSQRYTKLYHTQSSTLTIGTLSWFPSSVHKFPITLKNCCTEWRKHSPLGSASGSTLPLSRIWARLSLISRHILEVDKYLLS